MSRKYISIQLATTFKSPDIFKNGNWYGEYKIDGIRLLVFVYPDRSIKAVTRNNKNVTNKFKLLFPKYKLLVDNGLKIFKDGFVLDGEFYYESMFQTQSILFKKDTLTDKKCFFYIFDIIPLKSWNRKKCVMNYLTRKKVLNRIVKPEYSKYGFKLLEYFKIATKKDLDKFFHRALSKGYEGLVLKKGDSVYEFKRSPIWLKLKRLRSSEYKCIGVERGTGRNKDKLGAIIIDYNGKKVGVGSGFTDKQREYYWKNKDKIIGKKVEVAFYDETNKKSLRFPRFIKVRDDK